MKKTKHTPEPWHQGIYDNPKRFALAIFDEKHDEVAVADTVETARRIVACVNACAGISNEALEEWGNPAGPGMWGRAASNLQSQRDELLAALKECEPALLYVDDCGIAYDNVIAILKKYDHA